MAVATDTLDYSRFDNIEWGKLPPKEDYYAIDVETNGKPWFSGECEIRCVGICSDKGSEVLIPTKKRDRLKIARVLGDSRKAKVMHNAQADLLWLMLDGFEVAGPLHDTISMARVAFNLEPRVGLDYLGQKYCKMGKILVKEPWLLPIDEMIPYNQRDIEITFLLMHHYLNRRDTQDWWDTYQLELQLIHPVIRMHQIGMELNFEWCLDFMVKAGEEVRKRLKKFKNYNPNSWQQMNRLLFYDEGLKPAPDHQKQEGTWEDPSGKVRPYYSTAESWLKRMRRGTIVDDLLAYRSWFKDLGYVKGLVEFAQHDGRIHSSLLPYTAKTGRWSSKKPNLQQIPGSPHFVRHAFITPPGFELWSWDFDQMEIRIGAAESGERSLLNAFAENRDVHAETSKRLGITRDHAKVVIYAWMYGAGAETMADTLRVGVDEAEDIITAFRTNLPRLHSWARKIIREIKKKGSYRTATGRKFRCIEAYQAPDYYIQGTGADVLKRKMVDVHHHLRDYRSDILLPIHDELVGQVHHSEIELIPHIAEMMTERELYPKLPLTISRGLFYDKS